MTNQNITEEKIASLLLPNKERMEMINTAKFKQTNRYWNLGKMNAIQNVGSITYLFKEFNKKWAQKNPNSEKIMSKVFFFNEYIKSGKERMAKYQNVDRNKIPFKDNANNGRTMLELFNVSNDFRNLLKSENIYISASEALNYTIIRIIDQSYDGFIREEKTLRTLNKNLENNGEGLKYYHSSSFLDSKYSVDLVLKDSNCKMCGAIQVKPESYYYIDNKNTGSQKTLNLKKHKEFEKEYGIKPTFIYADRNGNIKNLIDIQDQLK